MNNARPALLTLEQREAIVVALRAYGASLSDDGLIIRGEKVLGVRFEIRKGRLRVVAVNGNVLSTYPASRCAFGVADFVERFWYWKPSL